MAGASFEQRAFDETLNAPTITGSVAAAFPNSVFHVFSSVVTLYPSLPRTAWAHHESGLPIPWEVPETGSATAGT